MIAAEIHIVTLFFKLFAFIWQVSIKRARFLVKCDCSKINKTPEKGALMTTLSTTSLESNKRVKINFNGGDLSSDAGLLLISEFASKVGLTNLVNRIFKTNDTALFRFQVDPDNLLQVILPDHCRIFRRWLRRWTDKWACIYRDPSEGSTCFPANPVKILEQDGWGYPEAVRYHRPGYAEYGLQREASWLYAVRPGFHSPEYLWESGRWGLRRAWLQVCDPFQGAQEAQEISRLLRRITYPCDKRQRRWLRCRVRRVLWNSGKHKSIKTCSTAGAVTVTGGSTAIREPWFLNWSPTLWTGLSVRSFICE